MNPPETFDRANEAINENIERIKKAKKAASAAAAIASGGTSVALQLGKSWITKHPKIVIGIIILIIMALVLLISGVKNIYDNKEEIALQIGEDVVTGKCGLPPVQGDVIFEGIDRVLGDKLDIDTSTDRFTECVEQRGHKAIRERFDPLGDK